MSNEIEIKYLISENGLNYASEDFYSFFQSVNLLKEEALKSGVLTKQGYLSIEKGLDLAMKIKMKIDFIPVEARLRKKGGGFYFTLKGEGDISRNELESQVSPQLFNKYWPWTKGKRIEKFRLKRKMDDHFLEIDVYTDRELIVSEIEISSLEEISKIPNLGKDVTTNPKYKNKNLAK